MFSYKTILKSWDHFFFEPESLYKIAFFRILWSSFLLIYLSQDLLHLDDLYGPRAILSQETVRAQFPYPHLNIFQYLGVNNSIVYFVASIYFLSLVFTLIGFKTKQSLFVAICCMVSFHQRNIWFLSSSEVLMRSISLLLLCSPCGYALSVDSYLNKKFSRVHYPKKFSPWAINLIQIQLSVVYVWTVWQKLKGENWIDGTALYYATRLDQFKNFPVPYLFDSLLLIKLATWLTLSVEIGLGIFIWFKEFRKPLIIIGIIFHLLIEYSMAIPFFEYEMIILLLTFFTEREYEIFYHKILSLYHLNMKPRIQLLRGTNPTV